MVKKAESSHSATRICPMASIKRTAGVNISSLHSFCGLGSKPWNVPDDEVVNALQKIWNVVYKKIPYKVKQKDTVCAVVRINFFNVSDAYEGYRPSNMPATHGVLQ